MDYRLEISYALDALKEFVSNVSNKILCGPALDEEEFNKQYAKELKDNLETFSKSIYSTFNASIFSGDYVDLPEMKHELEGIKKDINEFNILFENDELFYLNDFITIEYLKRAKKEIESSINAYHRFVLALEDRMKFNETKFYVNTIFKARYDYVNLKSTSLSEHCKFFDSNLFVAYCDHFVSSLDNSVILNLEDVINFTKEKSHLDYNNVLQKKSLFLRHKFIFREIEEAKTPGYNPPIYVAGKNENKPFSTNEFVEKNERLIHFKDWNAYLLNHYEIDLNWNNNIRSSVQLGNEFNSLSHFELHRIVKYAKDIIKDESLIIKVKNVFIERLTRSNNFFDKYALKISILYCYNNQFSLVTEQKIHDANKIQELYLEIESFINENKINNYFASAKYIRFLTDNIKEIIERKKVFENYGECLALISKCEELIEKYSNNVNWVKANYNYTFQLPKDDCIIDIGNSNNVFISSSFMLPISRKRLDENFKEDKDILNLFKISIQGLSFTKETSEQIDNLKAENQKVREAFDESEKRKLEIITIVTAVIAFISGSIPGFKFIESGLEAIYFTLALGTSLGFFVLLLYILNRKLISNKNLVKGSIAAAVMVILGWVFLFYTRHQNLNYNKKPDESNTTFKIENKLQHNQHNSTFQNKDSIAPER